MTAQTSRPAATARHHHLEQLAARLGRDGWYARLHTPLEGPPRLHVINPEMAALEEYVLAEQAGDEGWMFWFGWAERIGPADDVEAAVVRIQRVLALGGD